MKYGSKRHNFINICKWKITKTFDKNSNSTVVRTVSYYFRKSYENTVYLATGSLLCSIAIINAITKKRKSYLVYIFGENTYYLNVEMYFVGEKIKKMEMLAENLNLIITMR